MAGPVLEVNAVLDIPHVDATVDTPREGAQVGTLTISVEITKPKLELDDPSVV